MGLGLCFVVWSRVCHWETGTEKGTCSPISLAAMGSCPHPPRSQPVRTQAEPLSSLLHLKAARFPAGHLAVLRIVPPRELFSLWL